MEERSVCTFNFLGVTIVILFTDCFCVFSINFR